MKRRSHSLRKASKSTNYRESSLDTSRETSRERSRSREEPQDTANNYIVSVPKVNGFEGTTITYKLNPDDVEDVLGIRWWMGVIEYLIYRKGYRIREFGAQWAEEKYVRGCQKFLKPFADVREYLKSKYDYCDYETEDEDANDPANQVWYKENWTVESLDGIWLNPRINRINFWVSNLSLVIFDK